MRSNWFVGFPLKAGPWFTSLVADVPSGIRVFHPQDLHLTVAFLGACGQDAALAGWDVLADRCHSPVKASLGPLRPMGNRRRPSAYSLTFSMGADALAGLIEDWRNRVLEASGGPPDERSPLPHATVARPPRRASDAVRAAGLAWLQDTAVPAVDVDIDRVALYTWSDDRKEALFQIVRSRSLNGA
jgi:RNA 2',3'-cyclic 3'-phosphodiesterase